MKLDIAKKVSEVLSLRDAADDFFDAIEKSSDASITVNFSNVSFMSRSFAHQYLTRKKQSAKKITETNLPENIRKMFDVVKRPGKKHELPKPTFRRIDSFDAALS